MKSRYPFTLVFASALILGFIIYAGPKLKKIAFNAGSEVYEEEIDKREDWQKQLLANPSTGNIPDRMREKELAFAATLPNDRAAYKTGLGGNPWQNIGPWDVGGRTRVVVIDAADENILYTGAVTGGIWKSKDGGKNWERKTTPDQMPAITCMSQNPKHPDIIYAGTGEASGSSASDGGAYYLGNGVYKSIDRGETWTPVTRTTSNSPQSFDRNWDLVWKIVTYPSDTGDVFFAATYGSIYKSNNGGKGVTQAKGGTGPFGGRQSYYTDINVSAKGVLYASLSSEGFDGGIWRCADAVNWKRITPPNFTKYYDRIVSGIAPSDENQVYFLVHSDSSGKKSTNFRGDIEYNQLWKYTYTGDTTNPSLGIWEDLSQNIPDVGGQFGQFFTQQNYDMCVSVKPDDPNTVIIGGTNLWRSKDGFKSTTKTDWIGGYGVNTSLPDYKVYPNHHPDNHFALFYPSNAAKMLSTCDGGLFRTDDINANSVSWVSLNNGYLTTQFYTIAMDHAPSGNTIIGGLQDNGTHWSNNYQNPQISWPESFGGDGSHCYVPEGAAELFVSKQEGKTYKIKVDGQGKSTHFVRIDPLGARKKYQFINPFAVDPNSEKRIYIPDGDRIYRNNDISTYVFKTVLDSIAQSTGWEEVATTVDTLQTISAISVSKANADVLYYGTTNGKLYRIRTASQGQPDKTDITGSNFPAGNINCISLHPTDTNYIMAVFTNYEIKSIFYSRNGGLTWTDGSGNLEQFSTGAGNGPSCRWSAVLPMSGFNAYFMATSTGLYTTDTLMGSATKWVQQGVENIGNYPCTMIDTRPSDGLVIVATHGSGVYAANITQRYQVLGVSPNYTNSHIGADIYPNPASDFLHIKINQHIPGSISIHIYNIAGNCVKNLSADVYTNNGGQLAIPIGDLPSGSYFTVIESKEQRLIKKFQIIK